MPDAPLVRSIRLTTERFEPAPGSMTFPDVHFVVPAPEQRLAVGMVVYVTGLSTFFHPQYMALSIVPGWLCLGNEQGILWTHALQSIRRVDLASIPYLGVRRLAPGGRIVYDPIPEPLAVSLELEQRVFTDKMLLATLLPDQAYHWLQLITVARQKWIGDALQAGEIRM